MKEKIRKAIRFITNPRLLICFGIAWMITNGWAYVFLGIGTFCGVAWMSAIAGTYLAIIWLPVSPEKIITIAITMVLLRLLFPDDEKTLGKLREMRDKLKFKKKKK